MRNVYLKREAVKLNRINPLRSYSSQYFSPAEAHKVTEGSAPATNFCVVSLRLKVCNCPHPQELSFLVRIAAVGAKLFLRSPSRSMPAQDKLIVKKTGYLKQQNPSGARSNDNRREPSPGKDL